MGNAVHLGVRLGVSHLRIGRPCGLVGSTQNWVEWEDVGSTLWSVWEDLCLEGPGCLHVLVPSYLLESSPSFPRSKQGHPDAKTKQEVILPIFSSLPASKRVFVWELFMSLYERRCEVIQIKWVVVLQTNSVMGDSLPAFVFWQGPPLYIWLVGALLDLDLTKWRHCYR